MKLRTLLLASCVLLSTFAVGCAGPEPEEAGVDPAESAEDALTSSQLPGVAAISFEKSTPRPGDWTHADVTQGPTIAAKTKVSKILRALKTRRPSDPIPLCHPGSPRTRMKFFDAKGTVIATGGYSCMMGSVTVTDGGRTIPILVRTGALSDVLTMPLVPADALFGVDEITITRRGASPKTKAVKAQASVAALLDAIDLEQIDADFHGTRCLPSHTLSFARDGKEIAHASYICGSSSLPAKLTASFSVPDPKNEDETLLRGGLDLDPRVFEQALDER